MVNKSEKVKVQGYFYQKLKIDSMHITGILSMNIKILNK